MNRRTFFFSAAAATVAASRARSFAMQPATTPANGPLITLAEIEAIDRERVLRAANGFLQAPPITITATLAPQSKGGKHDYYSEADYFWPDPKNPDGPYIDRDGYSNPQNFSDHRLALIRMSVIVPALTAAWVLTQDKRYATSAASHLRAWFLAPETRMNPSLDYAQAVKGVATGRSYGIIDTLHLVEVARAARYLEAAQAMTSTEFDGVREWFSEYLLWMRSSTAGLAEEDVKNNHGTCWTVQVAAFGRYIGNENAMVVCRERFRNHLLPDQMALDGSFPLELKRTRPYNYSLFNLDMLVMVCVMASGIGASPSGATNNLWQFALADGSTLNKAAHFMFPFIEDKSKWPYPTDVEDFDDLPNRQPSLLFAGLAYREPRFIELWRRLPPDPKTAETIRNFPIRQPVLWLRAV